MGAGELGIAVLRNLAGLVDSGFDVSLSVLLRSPGARAVSLRKQAEIEELKSLGINFVFGDLAAQPVEDLARVFTKFDTVIGCTGFAAGKSIQLKLARAALAGGVKRYVPWQFGVDYELRQDPDNPMRKYRLVFAEGKGVSWPMEKTFNVARGIRVVGAEEWSQKHLTHSRSSSSHKACAALSQLDELGRVEMKMSSPDAAGGGGMKIAVVGATGATERRVVKHALAQGNFVTAVARHPERILSAERLLLVRGDVLSAEGLTGALDGVEAVIRCIGPEKNLSPGTLQSES